MISVGRMGKRIGKASRTSCSICLEDRRLVRRESGLAGLAGQQRASSQVHRVQRKKLVEQNKLAEHKKKKGKQTTLEQEAVNPKVATGGTKAV